jgi:hypothetical protein
MLVLGPLIWGGILIVGAVAAFIYSLRFLTEVRADGIYFKMWPLHRSFRRILWSEIERYESKRYSPLGEFGGWGIRWAPGKLAYTVSGNRGVWIERTGVQFSLGHNTPRNLSGPSTTQQSSLILVSSLVH